MRSFSIASSEPPLEVENIKSALFSTPPLSDDSILATVCPPVPDCCAAKSMAPMTESSASPTPVLKSLSVRSPFAIMISPLFDP